MGTKKKAVLSVLAVALLLIAAFPFFSTVSSAELEDYQQSITYHSNNGGDQTRIIIYDGIASTEYNPEFWEGTGHVPASIDVYIRQVDPVTGDLVKDQSDNQIYDLISAGTDIGNLAVYVNSGGTMAPVDENDLTKGYVKYSGTMAP